MEVIKVVWDCMFAQTRRQKTSWTLETVIRKANTWLFESREKEKLRSKCYICMYMLSLEMRRERVENNFLSVFWFPCSVSRVLFCIFISFFTFFFLFLFSVLRFIWLISVHWLKPGPRWFIIFMYIFQKPLLKTSTRNYR